MASTKVTFVSGGAEVRRREPIHSQEVSSSGLPQQVHFVEGKCGCCPYGYHIDLDFLNFCKDVENGSTLRNLKRIQKAKRKLRKSMEIMLDEQEGEGHPSCAPQQSLPPDVVHSTEAGRLMHMINYERSATQHILSQIDSSVNTTIANIDGGRGRRYMSSDSDEPVTPYSALPPQYKGYLEDQLPSFTQSGRTDSLSSLSSVSTVSSEAPMMHQAQLYQQQQQQHFQQQQQQIQQHYQQQQQQQQQTKTIKTTTTVTEHPVLEMATAEMKNQETPVMDCGTAEMKHYSTHSSAQLAHNGHKDVNVVYKERVSVERTPPAPPPRSSPSPDINQMSLQSVREAMAISLQRLRELEEQVKAIPILQVRISVLKEEKRLLNLQLKASKAQNTRTLTRSIGVGDSRVDAPLTPPVRSPPPTLPKPVRTFSVGVGDNSVVDPYLVQPNLPSGYTIRDNHTHTEIHSTTVVERDNVFSSKVRTPSLNMSFHQQSAEERNARLSSSYLQSVESNQPHFTINQIQRSAPRPMTRTVGVGDGNVFEGSGLHVHEKELRTVFIGQNDSVARRNVGIECRPATRDVGVSFMCDEEKPETRTVGVNVNCDVSGIHTSLDFKGEQELRMALRGVLQRNVHSVGTNCNFRVPTREASTSVEHRSGVDVGTGDQDMRVDVEVRLPTGRKTAWVTAKPDLSQKCVGTDKGWVLDAGTNTILVDKYTKSSMTDKQRVMVAATNTDPTHNRHSACQTETKMFLAFDQLKHVACLTDKVSTYSLGVVTDTVPSFNAATNTTEKVADLFRPEEEQTTTVTTTEIISKEPKPIVVDKAVGDGVIDDPHSFSETTEIISKVSSPVRSSLTVEEQILQRGASQANAFLTRADDSEDSSSTFSSYEISRRSSAPSTTIQSHNELMYRSSSQEELDQRNSAFDRVSPTKGEDGFSETVVEHFIITDEGRQLISREKERSAAGRGTTSSFEQILGGGTMSSFEQKSAGGGVSLDSRSWATHSSLNPGSVLRSASEDRDVRLGGGYSSHSSSVVTGVSRGSDRSSSQFTGTSSLVGLTGGSRHSQQDSWSSSGDSGTSRLVVGLTGSSTQGQQDNWSSSANFGTRTEKSYSTTVVTNPYKTVANLAEASSMLVSDSTDSGSTVTSRMSKTSSDGNLYKEKRHSALELGQSLDTIYDMRRAGSVEDFMPDDIRKYMSIDPSTSKDSNFGADFLERFSKKSSSSSSSSSRRSPDKSGVPRTMKMSKTVTTKRITKTGSDGNVIVQETKSVMGPDGKTITTVTETDGDGVTREIQSDLQSSQSSMSESSISSSSSSSSGFSSEHFVSGSESNLSSDHESMVSSGVSIVSHSESALGSLSGSGEDLGAYGSLDRKTGKLKSIMKQSKSDTEDSDKLSGKKGITFAESVTGGTGSSTEEEEAEEGTSDSDSTTSFEEGSYDSQQCEVSYRCKDDEAIAQGIPGAQMFDQNIRETYELNEEMQEACNVLSTYLMDSTSIRTTQLNASLNTIQQEWFRVSSHKLSSPHQVEDYLSSVNEISKRLLEYIVNMTDANGNTAIHYCISHCNFDIANLLLDSEVCDINKQNKAGYTPIMLAGLASPQNMEQREIIRRLFSHGDINARATATQQTALMLSASHGRTEMVMMLVEEGADINLQDVDGSTALMCACEHGHLEIVNFLLAHPSIDANCTDNEGSTALTIAMEAGHKDVGVILYKHLNFSPKATSPQFRYSVKTKQASESVL